MRRRSIVWALVLLLVSSLAFGQFGRSRRRGFFGSNYRFATVEDFDGSFQFCRGVYSQSSNGDGGNWSVDFPRADENLSIRLSELTKTSVGMDSDAIPKHLLVNFKDPVIFHCPFVMMTEVGSWYLADDEAVMLRNYLLKGGFLWVDDFWGEY